MVRDQGPLGPGRLSCLGSVDAAGGAKEAVLGVCWFGEYELLVVTGAPQHRVVAEGRQGRRDLLGESHDARDDLGLLRRQALKADKVGAVEEPWRLRAEEGKQRRDALPGGGGELAAWRLCAAVAYDEYGA